MTKIIQAVTVAALAVLPCFGATTTKLATQEWVKKNFASVGYRVSTGSVTTNIIGGSTGGPATTNVVFTSAYTPPDNTNCVEITFTVSLPTRAYRTVQTRNRRSLASLFAAFAASSAPKPAIHAIVRSGAWKDKYGNLHAFNFGDGWLIESQEELPDAPDSTHVCELDADCMCVDTGKSEKDVAIPDEYANIDPNVVDEVWMDIWSWVDQASWDDTSYNSRTGETTYWITDIDGVRFNLEKVAQTDAWKDAIRMAVGIVNLWMDECQVAYTLAHICDQENPQHDWDTKTCGTYSWSQCRNNPAHTEGEENHSFPGSSKDATSHYCKCGDKTEAHGTLVMSGQKTYTYSGTVKTGWTCELVCPKDCGYSEEITHVCHHTNCGPCDAGDGCDEECYCEGNHKFTGVKNGECDRCECPTCSDCAIYREGAEYHTGWTPCSKDNEEDNDDGTAAGAHCTCKCGWWSHNSALYDDNPSAHDYQGIEGEDPYMQIDDDKNASMRSTYHYLKIGKCTRCEQRKSKLEEHEFPEEPDKYKYVDDETCARIYICTKRGCEYEKRVEEEGGTAYSHSLPETPELYENVSALICRRKYKCANCQSYIKDDTHGHERDTENECKCKHASGGCTYQYDHSWVTEDNACAAQKCEHCGTVKPGVAISHSGYTSVDDETHVCACGRDTGAHVKTTTIGEWSDGARIKTTSCSVCPYTKTETETCGHPAWGEWVESGRTEGLIIQQRTCQTCGFAQTRTVPALPEGATTCDTTNDVHLAIASEATCGCVCGKYGVGALVHPLDEFHAWVGSVTRHGITVSNCLCVCKGKHRFREPTSYEKTQNPNVYCAGVCYSCRSRREDGSTANEEHHTVKPATLKTCGCKCGYYGVDSDDAGQVATAESLELHVRCRGDATGVAYCQCYGKKVDGVPQGGHRHWHFPKATCKKICAYKRTDSEGEEEEFGHLAAESDGEIGFREAVPNDHTKATYGCGCKCGDCKASGTGANLSKWKDVKELHGLAQNPANGDKCHCECGEQLLGPASTDKHVFETGECTCTCGQKHRSTYLNSCRMCSVCEKIQQTALPIVSVESLIEDNIDEHEFNYGACQCACGTHTLDHLAEFTLVSSEATNCEKCGAEFLLETKRLTCARCGDSIGNNFTTYEGEHEDWCPDKPRYRTCDFCGCTYSAESGRCNCSGHHCAACCQGVKTPKKYSPTQSHPNPPSRRRDPGSCTHPASNRSEDTTESHEYTCPICSQTLVAQCIVTRCGLCGKRLGTRWTHTGKHLPHDNVTFDNAGAVLIKVAPPPCGCGCDKCRDGTRGLGFDENGDLVGKTQPFCQWCWDQDGEHTCHYCGNVCRPLESSGEEDPENNSNQGATGGDGGLDDLVTPRAANE